MKYLKSLPQRLLILLLILFPSCLLLRWISRWISKQGPETIPSSHDSFDPNAYSTRPEDFKTWIDWYYGALPIPLTVTAILSGLVVYGIGFGIAYYINFHPTYVRTVPVYLGVFGIVWVTGSIRWASCRFHAIMAEIRPCFLVRDRDYAGFATKWTSRLSNNRSIFSVVLLMFILALIVAYMGIHRPDLLQQYAIQSMRPTLFPPAWYTGDLFAKMLIIDVYGLFAAFPLGTGTCLLIVNVFFLNDLRRLPVAPLPGVIIAKFRGITNFYLLVAFTWFVGVGLFGILLLRDLDIYAAVGILVLGSIGFLTFFVPQCVFHIFLVSAYREVADGVGTIYVRYFGLQTVREVIAKLGTVNALSRIELFTCMVEATQPVQMWVYDLSDVLILILGQLLALGGVALSSLLGLA